MPLGGSYSSQGTGTGSSEAGGISRGRHPDGGPVLPPPICRTPPFCPVGAFAGLWQAPSSVRRPRRPPGRALAPLVLSLPHRGACATRPGAVGCRGGSGQGSGQAGTQPTATAASPSCHGLVLGAAPEPPAAPSAVPCPQIPRIPALSRGWTCEAGLAPALRLLPLSQGHQKPMRKEKKRKGSPGSFFYSFILFFFSFFSLFPLFP